MNMRFVKWTVRSLYRAGSLMTVAKEISKYKLDLVGVQEERWDRSGTEPACEYTFFCGKGNENRELDRVGRLRRYTQGEVRQLFFPGFEVSQAVPPSNRSTFKRG
jgi:hypothetical protein